MNLTKNAFLGMQFSVLIKKQSIILFCFLIVTVACNNKEEKTIDTAYLIHEYDKNQHAAINETNGKLSLPYSQAAYKIAWELKDDVRIINSCIELSHDYEKLGDLNSSLTFTLEAANICERINENKRIANCYTKIGTIYSKQGDFDLGLKYLKDALKIHKKTEQIEYIVTDLNDIGEIYRLIGSFTNAKKYFTEALEYLENNDNSSIYAYVVGNLGLVYSSQALPDSSAKYIGKATSILQNLDDYYPISIFLTEDAKLLFEKGLYSEALSQINKSIQLSENENWLKQTSIGYKLLSKIQQKTGHHKEALDSYLKYDVLNDSLTNIGLVRKMESQRTDFEVSKRESAIVKLEDTNKSRTKTLVISGVITVLITILSMVLFLLTRKLKLTNSLLNTNKSELEQKNIKVQNALLEKETLLKEIHHRVKNNLQIISSLLSLQSRKLNDKAAKAAIENSHQRLQTISIIHQNLYQTENLAFINIEKYIQQLMEGISSAFSNENTTIEYKQNIEDVNFDVDTAVPLGLIINELAVNAYKYAFPPGHKGCITIDLKADSKTKYKLVFKDNGIGLPDNFDLDTTTSLGIRLVKALSGQLKGELSINSDGGAEFTLLFTDKDYRNT